MTIRSGLEVANEQLYKQFRKNMNEHCFYTLSAFLNCLNDSDEADWKWEDNAIVFTPFALHPSTKVRFSFSCLPGELFPVGKFYILENNKKIMRAVRYRESVSLYRAYHYSDHNFSFFVSKDKIYSLLFQKLQSIFKQHKEKQKHVSAAKGYYPKTAEEIVVPDFTSFSLEDADIQSLLSKLTQLHTLLSDDAQWLTTEEIHKITHTYPHDLMLIFSVYQSMNQANEEVMEETKRSIHTSLLLVIHEYESLLTQTNERKKQRIQQQEEVIKIRSEKE